MRLLVYCPVPPRQVQESLGLPEYSYVFVAERFRPVLDQLGEVREVADAAAAEAEFARARTDGEPCVLIAFAPPNRAPVDLGGPTVSLFAWEFETIPTETWGDDPLQDWRRALAAHGSAICLSTHTREAVLAAMGDDFPVTALPAPIHDRFRAPGRAAPDLGERSVAFTGLLIDRDQFDPVRTTLLPGTRLAAHHDQDWGGAPVRMTFTDDSSDRGSLVGFYRSESWGTWSRVEHPWLLLPFPLAGRIRMRLHAVGYGPNVGRRITVSVAGVGRQIQLSEQGRTYGLAFDLPDGVEANTVEFSGLTVSRLPDALDVRSMALGLCWLEVERVEGPRRLVPRPLRRAQAGQQLTPSADPVRRTEVTVSGVVFTTVLNPNDGRKNWEDLVTAFCWAFRDEPRATLLIKMTHRSLVAYLSALQFLLHRIGPVSCRVIALHGFLSDEELAALAGISTFYVNSSEAEGLCMPLMEFLSAGVPAIAPDHTAMADYVDPASCFVVTSSPFPTIWPQDPRQLWKAHKYRIHWDSLVTAYQASFTVATQDPARYAAMSAAAVSGQESFSSDVVVRAALAGALAQVPS